MKFFWPVILLIFLTFAGKYSHADDGIYLIRDNEIQDYLGTILEDVLISSNINPVSVKLFIVNSQDINAFVSGGMNVFVNLGLITSANSPEVIYGVLAHEVGHIRGAHLVKSSIEVKKNAIITGIVGLGAFVIASTAGSGIQSIDAAQATILASSHAFERSVLSFTRKQEEEADRYALETLKDMNIGTDGVVYLFSKLLSMQGKYVKNIDKYSITHPLTSDRISFFTTNKLLLKKTPKYVELEKKHCLCSAKIEGFFNIDKTIFIDNSFLENPECKSYYEIYLDIGKKNLHSALAKLINYEKKFDVSKNPYFYETLGDVYYPLGQFENSRFAYAKSLKINYNTNILLKLTRSLILTNDKKNIELAIAKLDKLNAFTNLDKEDMLEVYDQLSRGYYVVGKKILSDIFLIRQKIITLKLAEADRMLARLKDMKPQMTPFELAQFELIENEIKDLKNERESEQ